MSLSVTSITRTREDGFPHFRSSSGPSGEAPWRLKDGEGTEQLSNNHIKNANQSSVDLWV